MSTEETAEGTQLEIASARVEEVQGDLNDLRGYLDEIKAAVLEIKGLEIEDDPMPEILESLTDNVNSAFSKLDELDKEALAASNAIDLAGEDESDPDED